MQEPPRSLDSIEQLQAAPYNPRRISPEAALALTQSLISFGDLSGITWNAQTGNLVCGHQRMNSLRGKYGDKLRLDEGAIFTPDGQMFAIRVVDWDEATERVANLAANNPHMAGEFTGDVTQMLKELEAAGEEQFSKLRLDTLLEDFPEIITPTSVGSLAKDHGNSYNEKEFWPFLKFQIPHKLNARWEALLEASGKEPHKLFEELIAPSPEEAAE